MKNKEYWKKRSEALVKEQYKKTDEYTEKLIDEFSKLQFSIQRDIEVFYQRYSKNNKLSLEDVNKNLNIEELKELKFQLKDFVKKTNNDNFDRELNSIYYKTRISRLESLQSQIKAKVDLLFNKHNQDITELLKDLYEDNYYKNIFEVQKGLGIGVNFSKLNDRSIKNILMEPWNNDNYSNRIWNNRGKLLGELQTTLFHSVVAGYDVKKTSKKLANRMNVATNRASVLVNTESAYMISKSTFDSYKESGIKKYEILATLDLKTSSVCREMDGKVFYLKDKSIGLNAPPFHPNCRSTTVACFDDEIDEERIAKDSKGKKYYVDGDINYRQWHDKYVKDNPSEKIAEKKLQNKHSDKKIFERYSQVLKNLSPKSFEQFQDLRYNDINGWNELKSNFKVANSYKVDYGEINPQKILELDKVAFEAKKTRFDYEPFSGRERRSVKKLSQGGNFAIMEFQNKQYLAHSAVNETVEAEYKSIKGDKSDFILHKDDREFKTLVINGIPREYCTEAKFFEFINDNITIDYSGEITILSELDMCESCRGVLKQFKNKYPNVKVNIVSGKKCLNWRKRK
ncbi:phage head morphogenesis protein [Clostridium botulinum]|nr:phage head morphogenesis protein [Clostridium botulinum]NFL02409.1 phage head morphogenesis protein [Clostridium botulinum]